LNTLNFSSVHLIARVRTASVQSSAALQLLLEVLLVSVVNVRQGLPFRRALLGNDDTNRVIDVVEEALWRSGGIFFFVVLLVGIGEVLFVFAILAGVVDVVEAAGAGAAVAAGSVRSGLPKSCRAASGLPEPARFASWQARAARNSAAVASGPAETGGTAQALP